MAAASLDALATRGIDVSERYRQWLDSGSARRCPPLGTLEPSCAQGRPLYIAGVPSAASINGLLEANREQPDGYAPALHLIEPEWDRFFAMLAEPDAAALLGNPRVRLLVGPDAIQQFGLLLDERLGFDLKGPILSAQGQDSFHASVEQTLTDALDRQREELSRLLSANAARYTGKTPDFWRCKFQGADDSEPLRVLIPTTRYSTYVQHASGDLARAFEQLGCEVRLLSEPDASTRFTSLTYARAVYDLQPDLVLLINYTRAHMQPSFPEGLPFVCWIQDALQHLFDARIGAAQGPLDFVMGHVHTTLFKDFGYPPSQALFSPVLVSERKFHSSAVSSAQRTRYACEIACVTNHSETPEMLQRTLLAGAAQNQVFQGVVDELIGEIRVILSRIELQPFAERMQRAIHRTLAARNMAQDAAQVTALYNQVCVPIADRMLRHETLSWAAELAEEHGWRLRIYGQGWDQHPALARFAEGPIAHGEDLRASYQCAAVNLHASINWNLHQRVMECALSGGLPISRFKLSDIEMLVCFANACLAESSAELLPTDEPQWFRMPILEHSEAMCVFGLLQRFGPEWTERFSPSQMPPCAFKTSPGFLANPWSYFGGSQVHREIPWLLGDLSETTFRSKGELKQRVERAIESPAWRENISNGIAGRVKRHLTYEGAAKRMLQFVGERCESTSGSLLAPSA